MTSHITVLVSTSFAILRQLRSVSRSLTQDATRHLVQSLILSRIDYRNVAFDGLPLELCADVIVSAAARRSILVGGGGAAPVQKNWRRAVRRGRPKTFFIRFTKKFRSILKIFLGTFLAIKALRFADVQC